MKHNILSYVLTFQYLIEEKENYKLQENKSNGINGKYEVVYRNSLPQGEIVNLRDNRAIQDIFWIIQIYRTLQDYRTFGIPETDT